MALVVKLAAVIGAIYLVVAVAAFAMQRRLMYFPDPLRVDPSTFSLSGVEERELKSPDGATLVAWYARAAPGQPTLLYFHGNAGNLASRSERIRKYIDRGIGMFMLSYRGYGGSTGSPSERANVADANLAYEALINDGVVAEDIILYGESLGSGVAVQLAAEKPVGGLILDAPYTSIVDVAAKAYPFLPVRGFIFDRYDSMSHLNSINTPLLVLHGEEDEVIPVSMGRAVYDAAKGLKEIVTFPGAGHNDHQLFGSYEEVVRWIGDMRRGTEVGQPKMQMRP